MKSPIFSSTSIKIVDVWTKKPLERPINLIKVYLLLYQINFGNAYFFILLGVSLCLLFSIQLKNLLIFDKKSNFNSFCVNAVFLYTLRFCVSKSVHLQNKFKIKVFTQCFSGNFNQTFFACNVVFFVRCKCLGWRLLRQKYGQHRKCFQVKKNLLILYIFSIFTCNIVFLCK